MLEVSDFNAIRISLASPEQIRSWSYGEVTKPETINYRSLKPEKDGLFCERIFGPTKDFECYCGKYKRMRYKGIICDKCGVEVARSKVRRERMGHIELAAPVAHMWFSRGIPSRLGVLLDLSPRGMERVLYFAQYLVISVNQEACQRLAEQWRKDAAEEMSRRQEEVAKEIERLKSQLEEETQQLEATGQAELAQLEEELTKRLSEVSSRKDHSQVESEFEGRREEKSQQLDTLLKQRQQAVLEQIDHLQNQLTEEKVKRQQELSAVLKEVENLSPLTLLSEIRYRDLRDRCGDVFTAGMGAEAILQYLKGMDLDKERGKQLHEIHASSGQRRKKATKRLRMVEAFRRSGNKPEWMILTVLPVLPPDLRPMVQLDGGRFAISDLNDLYRRVINRNNRLRRLLVLEAPDIIVRNEKRMLQEAVDSLIDNGRRGRAVSTGGEHKLKSLSDMLRGKQGRFRQNLLGKRVDYSGRSVIVAGPELKLHQCGLPKRMALELFKPFIMRRLVEQGLAHNIKSARRMVERAKPEVWGFLEEEIKGRPVFLNRAPTLHRLGIQAFEPVLVDGSAIQIHPLVCTAFNSDFDGDQMAVHLPLSKMAVREARELMLSVNNMLLPSSGEPVVTPTLDMVLGCYYLTIIQPGAKGEGSRFSSFDEARLAYDLRHISLGAKIEVRHPEQKGQRLQTSMGRIIFNEVLPHELRFVNQIVDKASLKRLVVECYKLLGNAKTAEVLDNLKRLGFHYATKSGTTIAMNDIEVPPCKAQLLEEADRRIAEAENQYHRGLITEDERYASAVQIWTEITDRITEAISSSLDRYGGVYLMANSGAKGNIAQIRQMAGMRGLMADPSGRIIEFPIRSSFREGLSVLEYFISTHGARKGLADTALRTSDSGYLTRRLIDVSQDVIVLQEDCGTSAGTWIGQVDDKDKSFLAPLAERLVGRLAARPVADPKTGEILVEHNQEMDEEMSRRIMTAGIDKVYVRSPLTCSARRGVCRFCYGRDLARGRLVALNTAVGIIAAQSIGEPGTQLTMRTFHTGGVVGLDITSGLPRVEDLFEARAPKGEAKIADIDGAVEVLHTDEGRHIKVVSSEVYRDEYPLPSGYHLLVADGDAVTAGAPLAQADLEAAKDKDKALAAEPVLARVAGRVSLEEGRLIISYEEREEREYIPQAAVRIRVETGARVRAGDQLTDGTKNPQDILRIMGREAVQQYLVEEVQKVYRAQGVNINDKHIEIIVRQMLARVMVESSGDTDLLPGQLIDRFIYEGINAKVLAEGGEPATAQAVLLGITRASLTTESWMAAASFQETTRVLTDAAISGKIDRLLGLKENVIIGKLIPARALEPVPLPVAAVPSLFLSEGELPARSEDN